MSQLNHYNTMHTPIGNSILTQNQCTTLQLDSNNLTKNPYYMEYLKLDFENNEIKSMSPHYNWGDITPTMIKSNSPIKKLEVIIGGSRIYEFNLEFCNKLFGIEPYDDSVTTNYIYKIPWLLLNLKPIFAKKLSHHNIVFKLHHNNEEECQAKLYLKNKKHQISNMKNITTRTVIIQNQDFGTINEGTTTTSLNFQQSSNGIFLDNINMEAIEAIKLTVNGATLINCDNKMKLSLFLKKITNDCYYLSFNNSPFNSMNFDKSLSFSFINQTSLTIESIVQQENVTIKSLSSNNLKYLDGCCGHHYSSSSDVPSGNLSNGFQPSLWVDDNIFDYSSLIEPKKKIEMVISGKLKVEKIDQCPICRINDSDIVLNCYHQYCETCIKEVINAGLCSCPYCNKEIKSFHEVE